MPRATAASLRRERERNKANKNPKPLGDSCRCRPRGVRASPLSHLCPPVRVPPTAWPWAYARRATRGNAWYRRAHPPARQPHPLSPWPVLLCLLQSRASAKKSDGVDSSSRGAAILEDAALLLEPAVVGQRQGSDRARPHARRAYNAHTLYNLRTHSASPLCATLRLSLLSLSRSRVSPPAADAAPGL